MSAIIAHGRRHPEAASVSEPLRDSDSAAGRRGWGPAAIKKSRPPAERAARGLSISDTLQIARQIADALEAAHEQGIIHRDLKPANIKVRDDGTVKVLDFGLAKAIEPAFAQGASAGQAPSLAPTITSPAMTQMGMILGTAAYMAPEQARGRPVDKRADIWAFGCVLFELLTGRRAFEGDDVSSTLAKVLEREPALDLVPANVPPVVRRGLRRCLQKDPRQRVRDMGDVRLALDGAFDEAEATQAVGKPRAPWVVATAVLAAFAVAGWLWPRSGAQVERRDLTLTIAPPSATGIVPLNYAASGPTISPNGTMVAYRDGSNGLQLRRLDALGLERLDLPAGLADFGAWSAGSRSFVTDSGGELWQIGVPGGGRCQTRWACTRRFAGKDGDLLYALVKSSVSLFILPARGGESQAIALPGLPAGSYDWPEFLPGTNEFLVLFDSEDGTEAAIYLATLRDGKPADPVLLMRNRTAPHYTPARGGQLFFVRDNVLYAQTLSPTNRRLEGEPEAVVSEVSSAAAQHVAKFSVSMDGVLAWRAGRDVAAQLTTFDRAGRRIGTSGPPGQILFSETLPRRTASIPRGPERAACRRAGSIR